MFVISVIGKIFFCLILNSVIIKLLIILKCYVNLDLLLKYINYIILVVVVREIFEFKYCFLFLKYGEYILLD